MNAFVELGAAVRPVVVGDEPVFESLKQRCDISAAVVEVHQVPNHAGERVDDRIANGDLG